MAGLTPLGDARSLLLGAVTPLAPRPTATGAALGLVLAEDVVAAEDVPPFANTAMDGFAVRAGDTVGAPVRLAVVGTITAGDPPEPAVGPGEAVRIMTGAPIPPGADAVVMVERTRPAGEGAVEVLDAVVVGQHVRPAGDDVRAGTVVVTAGTPLRPAHLGVLANLGVTEVRAHPRPRVGVLSTGDELVEAPPGRLGPGKIRDSNRPMLLAELARSGFAPVDLGRVGDDEDAIAAAVQDGTRRCDAVLTSGGVSVGDADLVKAVLDRLGRMHWLQIAIKPAKPFAFGIIGDVPVFGLPGNPVSSAVSFELLARPALRRLGGHTALDRPRLLARATEPLRRSPDGKTHYQRVVVTVGDGRLAARPAGGQGSHQLGALAAANGLAVVPDGDGVDAGADVEVLLLDDPVG